LKNLSREDCHPVRLIFTFIRPLAPGLDRELGELVENFPGKKTGSFWHIDGFAIRPAEALL